MKIYISGKISGLLYDDVLKKFDEAEMYLKSLGHEPVNPLNNGLDPEEIWEKHMVADIEVLFQCEGIYLLQDWRDSKGARIEKSIAEIYGLDIFYAQRMNVRTQYLEEYNTTIKLVFNKVTTVIEEVTGLSFDTYKTRSRKRETYYCRMLFSQQCFSFGIENKSLIGRYINRDHAVVGRMLENYPNEFNYNSEFRRWAEAVEKKICLK